MTVLRNVNITSQDSPSIDAFSRWRVSNATTIFDSKLLHQYNFDDNWDTAEVSGSGTSSTFSANQARSRLSVSASTAGKRVEQTFQRFNYIPGNSQLVVLTGVLGAPESGITQEIGYGDDENGLFFSCVDGIMYVRRRTFTSGSAVDNDVAQSSWNLDKMDGTGKSGVTLDFTKTQIFIIDFQWLGVGRIRFGFDIDGLIIYCHEIKNANNLDVVYMSTPNLPVRYSIENDGTGGASFLDHICTSVVSEGGLEPTGVPHYKSTAGTHVNANTANTIYAIVGIRLQTTSLDTFVEIINITMANATGDDYEWILLHNPTVAGTFTFTDHSNGGMQVAVGATANTVTGGHAVDGGLVKASGNTGDITSAIRSNYRVGSLIDGTRDIIVLCCRPLSSNADIEGSISWVELS